MANPSGNHQEPSHPSSSFNGGNPANDNSAAPASAPESSGSATAMKHNPGISMDWTAEEQGILEEGLSNLASDNPISESSAAASTGELQNIQAAYRLNGKNFLKWSQMVRTLLKGRGKLSRLLGSGPKEGDPRSDAWDEQDSMVMSWLWNSMLPEISDTSMFLGTAEEIWDAVKQTYSKVHDAAQIYELKTKLSATKQGMLSVTEYSNRL